VNAKGGALGKKFEVITLDDNNTRNPDNRVQFLNCGQLATELTNEQCSFWHFRFAGSVEMRAVAQTKSLPQSVKSVYMLNQDYLFGQSVEKDSLISHRRREINQIRLSA
jgi:branched-chain amino acid transport system substrate-binding protein